MSRCKRFARDHTMAKKGGGPRFTKFAAGAVFDKRLTPMDVRVLAALGVHADSRGVSYPKQETLAKRLGVKRRTVNRSIAKLIACGRAKTEAQFGASGLRRESLYVIKLEDDPAPESEPAVETQESQQMRHQSLNGCDRGVSADETQESYPVRLRSRTKNDPILTNPPERAHSNGRRRAGASAPAAAAARKAQSEDQKIATELRRLEDRLKAGVPLEQAEIDWCVQVFEDRACDTGDDDDFHDPLAQWARRLSEQVPRDQTAVESAPAPHSGDGKLYLLTPNAPISEAARREAERRGVKDADAVYAAFRGAHTSTALTAEQWWSTWLRWLDQQAAPRGSDGFEIVSGMAMPGFLSKIANGYRLFKDIRPRRWAEFVSEHEGRTLSPSDLCTEFRAWCKANEVWREAHDLGLKAEYRTPAQRESAWLAHLESTDPERAALIRKAN